MVKENNQKVKCDRCGEVAIAHSGTFHRRCSGISPLVMKQADGTTMTVTADIRAKRNKLPGAYRGLWSAFLGALLLLACGSTEGQSGGEGGQGGEGGEGGEAPVTYLDDLPIPCEPGAVACDGPYRLAHCVDGERWNRFAVCGSEVACVDGECQ